MFFNTSRYLSGARAFDVLISAKPTFFASSSSFVRRNTAASSFFNVCRLIRRPTGAVAVRVTIMVLCATSCPLPNSVFRISFIGILNRLILNWRRASFLIRIKRPVLELFLASSCTRRSSFVSFLSGVCFVMPFAFIYCLKIWLFDDTCPALLKISPVFRV